MTLNMHDAEFSSSQNFGNFVSVRFRERNEPHGELSMFFKDPDTAIAHLQVTLDSVRAMKGPIVDGPAKPYPTETLPETVNS